MTALSGYMTATRPALAMVLLMAASVLPAADYFVSTSGNDSSAGTSLATPWKTIGRSTWSLLPGDTVHVRGGTYTETVYTNRAGTAQAPITFTNYQGEKVIIDGGQNAMQFPAYNYTSVMLLDGAYTTVDGFEIRNGGYAISARAPGVRIWRCVLHDTNVQVINITGNGVLNAEIRWCTIYNGGLVNYGGRGLVNGVIQVTWPTIVNFSGHYDDPNFVADGCLMADNVLYDSWGEGFAAYNAKNVVMERNVAYNLWRMGYYIQNVQHAVVRNNLSYYDVRSTHPSTQGNAMRWGMGVANEYQHTLTSDVQFLGNLVVGGSSGIGSFGSAISGLVIANNTIADCATGLNLGNAGAGLQLLSNIITAGNGTTLAQLPSGSTCSHNCWWGGSGRPTNGVGPGDLLANPQLTGGVITAGNLTSTYFVPVAGSPVYGAGIAVPSVTADFAGHALPPYSMGAFTGSPASAPVITTQPVNRSVTTGQTATFTVTATGIPTPTYQWQKGGVNIAGATAASYTTPATTVADTGLAFRVVVSNRISSVASTAATLTVTAPPTGGLPNGWTAGDIGSVAKAGSASESAGIWTVIGSGADIWNTADGFAFARQAVTGDVRITAKVNSVGNTNAWAKAGVMVRESTAAGSRHAFTCVTPANGVAYQRRLTTAGASSHTAGPIVTAPYWVRLERVGNVLISSCSANGTTWTEIRRETIAMNATLLVGLAVTAHADGALCTATFSNVEIVSTASTAN